MWLLILIRIFNVYMVWCYIFLKSSKHMPIHFQSLLWYIIIASLWEEYPQWIRKKVSIAELKKSNLMRFTVNKRSNLLLQNILYWIILVSNKKWWIINLLLTVLFLCRTSCNDRFANHPRCEQTLTTIRKPTSDAP